MLMSRLVKLSWINMLDSLHSSSVVNPNMSCISWNLCGGGNFMSMSINWSFDFTKFSEVHPCLT